MKLTNLYKHLKFFAGTIAILFLYSLYRDLDDSLSALLTVGLVFLEMFLWFYIYKDSKIGKTIINIWNITDLRDRILITLGLIAIYRLGSFVVIKNIIARIKLGNANIIKGNLHPKVSPNIPDASCPIATPSPEAKPIRVTTLIRSFGP